MDSTAQPATIVPGVASGTIDAPTSKSLTNRLVVVSLLAAGASTLRSPLLSDDTRRMRDAAIAFGARVDAARDEGDHAGRWTIIGVDGAPSTPAEPVDVGLSGTCMRFLMSVGALCRQPVTLTGDASLRRRPVGPLSAALRAMGARVEDQAGFPPVTISSTGLRGGSVSLDASGSSQFATAVLLVAPYTQAGVRLNVTGVSASGYLDLTVGVMRDWGVTVDWDGRETFIASGQRYQPRDVAVEFDASAAAHLFGLAMATGGEVTVRNARLDTLQPDARIVEVLEQMGGTSRSGPAGIQVAGPAQLLPVDVDLSRMPDQLPTIAALAALAPGPSRLRGLAVTRGHETDRMRAVTIELGKLGVEVDEHDDDIVIRGGNVRGPARLATYGDHRMAMAWACLAARVPGIRIEEPGCVAKTYPAFWQHAAQLGLHVETTS